MLAPVISGIPGAGTGSGMAPPQSAPAASAQHSLSAPIFGQSAKLGLSSPPVIQPTQASLSTAATAQAPSMGANSIGSTSFAALAHSSTSVGVAKEKEVLLKTDTKIINTAKPVSGSSDAKTTDIDTLKKKLAMMERETSRLRFVHLRIFRVHSC